MVKWRRPFGTLRIACISSSSSANCPEPFPDRLFRKYTSKTVRPEIPMPDRHPEQLSGSSATPSRAFLSYGYVALEQEETEVVVQYEREYSATPVRNFERPSGKHPVIGLPGVVISQDDDVLLKTPFYSYKDNSCFFVSPDPLINYEPLAGLNPELDYSHPNFTQIKAAILVFLD